MKKAEAARVGADADAEKARIASKDAKRDLDRNMPLRRRRVIAQSAVDK